jgi:ketosteroid isomerase-like protein
MSADNVNLVQSVYDAFGRADVPAVLAAFSPNIRWVPAEHSPADRGEPYVGPQEVVQHVFMRIANDWDSFVIVPTRLFDAGDTVIMEGRYGGIYKATGKVTKAQVVHIWQIQDGKLIEFRQYTDTAELRDVLGGATQVTTSA